MTSDEFTTHNDISLFIVVFELGEDTYIEGVYDGVISSKDYPQPVQSLADFSFTVYGIPLDVFVTYSIISPDTEFEGSQLVQVSSGEKILHFDSSASSQASLKQSDNPVRIQAQPSRSNRQHSVFLLRYQGLSRCPWNNQFVFIIVWRDLKNLVSEMLSTHFPFH